MENLQDLNDEMSIQMCDEEHLPCKTCKWAQLAGPTCGSCSKFKNKPEEVYFDSQPCPKYEEYKNVK